MRRKTKTFCIETRLCVALSSFRACLATERDCKRLRPPLSEWHPCDGDATTTRIATATRHKFPSCFRQIDPLVATEVWPCSLWPHKKPGEMCRCWNRVSDRRLRLPGASGSLQRHCGASGGLSVLLRHTLGLINPGPLFFFSFFFGRIGRAGVRVHFHTCLQFGTSVRTHTYTNVDRDGEKLNTWLPW